MTIKILETLQRADFGNTCLSIFKDMNGQISLQMFEAMKLKTRGVHLYQIRNNKLYRSKDCYFPSRCEGIEHFLYRVLSKHPMPDMDFFINVSDYPQSPTYHHVRLPIFSFSKIPNKFFDIMYPAWTFWAGGPAVWPLYPYGLGRWDLLKSEIDATNPPVEDAANSTSEFGWENKINKGFFRGSRTNGARDNLVLLSRSRPDVVNASYTGNQKAVKDPRDLLYAESEARPVNFIEHCKYKYLFNFTGVAASFRFKFLFLCKSLVFHIGEEDWNENFVEFFYKNLIPYYHYVPIRGPTRTRRDREDYQPLPVNHKDQDLTRYYLDFFMRNPRKAKIIADNGYNFIKQHLTFDNIDKYWYRLLLGYQKLCQFPPQKVDLDKSKLIFEGNPPRQEL